MRVVFTIFIILSLLLVSCTTTLIQEIKRVPTQNDTTDQDIHPIQLPGNYVEDDELIELRDLPIRMLEDGTNFLVHPDKLVEGGPPKDGIPAISNPEFETVEDASQWIEDNESLLFLDYNGVKKAYPMQIMVWHEIVNDYAAGYPLAISFCPLCHTGIAYSRIIDNREVSFGTSGYLFQTNMVMYDDVTQSLWPQADGIAVVGNLTGTELEQVPLDVIKFIDIKTYHPETNILSRNTGYNRSYGTNPYISYYTDDTVWFPEDFDNHSINTKEMIYGIEVNGVYKAYRETDIEGNHIEDVVGGVPVVISKEAGVVVVVNTNTGKEINEQQQYWYSWYAFHPDTLLYEKK